MSNDHVTLATEAGFTLAAKTVSDLQDRRNRLARAFEHFRYVTKEQITAFNKQLRAKTSTHTGEPGYDLVEHFDQLVMIAIDKYRDMPPADVLTTVAAVAKQAIFDTMEVAKIQGQHAYKDPIVFGCVTGCPHYFYITSWDDDVKIEDLLKAHEG